MCWGVAALLMLLGGYNNCLEWQNRCERRTWRKNGFYTERIDFGFVVFVVLRWACWRNPSLFSYQQMTSYIEGGRVWKNGKLKFHRSARMTLKGEIKITWGGLEFLRLVNSPQGFLKDDSIRLNWITKTFLFRKPKNRFYRDQNGFREIGRFYLYRYLKFE